MNICKKCYWWKKRTSLEGQCLKLRDYQDGKLLITFEQEFCGKVFCRISKRLIFHRPTQSRISIGRMRQFYGRSYKRLPAG